MEQIKEISRDVQYIIRLQINSQNIDDNIESVTQFDSPEDLWEFNTQLEDMGILTKTVSKKTLDYYNKVNYIPLF